MISVDLHRDYDEALKLAVEIVKQGKVFVFPTDTLYGIGCDATNTEAVKRIYRIKKRDEQKPVSILISGMEDVEELCDISDEEREWMLEHLPGPYTILLKLKQEKVKLFSWLKRDKIGVRIPNYVFIRKVAELSGKPIIATSANISGSSPPKHHNELSKQILTSVDLVICAGETKYKRPSTVIDIKENKILR